MQKYTPSDDYNPVNEGQDASIQEYQEDIQIPGANEISEIESTASNVIRSQRERYPVEILGTTMKGRVYMQVSKVKKI